MWKRKIALFLILLYSLIWFGIGICGLYLCVNVFEEQDLQIYNIMCALSSFWCSLTFFILFLRIKGVENFNNFYTQHQFYRAISLLNFQYFRYIMISLQILQFYSTIYLFTNLSNFHLHYLYSDSQESIALLVPICMLLQGFFSHVYIFTQFTSLICSWEGYWDKQNYVLKSKLSKKQTTILAIFWIILFIIYYLAKCCLLISILSQENETHIIIFTSILLCQSISIILFLFQVIYWLKFIYSTIPEQDLIDILDYNKKCFAEWSILIQSIIYSEKCTWTKFIIASLLLTQTIYGIIKFPFYFFINRIDNQAYTNKSYLYGDTAVITGFVVTYIFLELSRMINRYRSDRIRYNFKNQFNKISFEDIEFKQKECCICLQEMNTLENLQRLSCHHTHIFHSTCIGEWLQAHSTCPICKTQIREYQ